jgi:hypothetical protein
MGPMIETHNESKFTPIQQLKCTFLLLTESAFHLRSKTIVDPDPENNSKLILKRVVMTQADKDSLL